VDLGASAIHLIVLDASRRVIDGRVLAPEESGQLLALAEDATAVAIDAPAALSTAPHAADASLSPKFRRARCCEIALGRRHGLWVPWVTPQLGGPVPAWMKVGFELYRQLQANGSHPIEVFPYAGFKRLAGGSALLKKTTPAGIRRRVELLEAQGVGAHWLRLWSHDAIDAALAALLALGSQDGWVLRVGCDGGGEDDGSAIWVPARS
jgi:predicted nuclease with RNAse H fold